MAKMNDDGEICAGGGILTELREGRIHVLLVHRHAYGDWSIPKGKTKNKETDESAALREVEEETGLRCHLGSEAGSMHYLDHRDRKKVARYWLMTAAPMPMSFNHEVDKATWFPLEEAMKVATRSGDRDFLTALSAVLVTRGQQVHVMKPVHIWEIATARRRPSQ
jgi:8-oxo-dGTP pyrophosphatase MutT (NUDIX family)